MNSFSEMSTNYIQGAGYRIYPGLLDRATCQETFFGATLELCHFVFGNRATELISRYGIQTTRLIADVNFRKEAGISEADLRRNGNPRESKVLKKSGKTPLYISRFIRDGVRRNQNIASAIAEIYGTNKLAFTAGLDHLIYKTESSEESPAVVDAKLFEPLQPSDSLQNPFHFLCLVCLATSNQGPSEKISHLSPNRNSMELSSSESTEETSAANSPREAAATDGSVSILEGFDRYYEDIKSIIGIYGKHPITRKKKKNTANFTVLDNFDLQGVNSELKRIHSARLETSPQLGEFVPLRWVKVPLHPGDVLILDCRIPYRTARNKNSHPAVFAPVSLRPVNPIWYNSPEHRQLVAAVTEGKAGDWRKRTLKDCNLEEYGWRSRLDTLPKSTLKACIATDNFTLHDRLIFGISHYSF
jgi:hypothetical protein